MAIPLERMVSTVIPPPETYVTVYGMKRTTVYLPGELKKRLERIAHAEGRSEAELIREGVRRVLEAHTAPRPRIPLFESDDPHLAMTPLRFACPSPPSGWAEDFHLQAVSHARHTRARGDRFAIPTATWTTLRVAHSSHRLYYYLELLYRVPLKPAAGVPFLLAITSLAIRVGAGAQNALLEEVERGAYRLAPFSAEDVGLARQFLRQYSDLDLGLGLADASILVLAERHEARDVLTLDHRHFRAVAGPEGEPLRLLPEDHEPPA